MVSAEYLWPLQDVAMKRYKSEVERERQCGETKFEGSFFVVYISLFIFEHRANIYH